MRAELTKKAAQNEEEPLEGSIIEEVAKSNKSVVSKHDSSDVRREPVIKQAA